MPIFIFVILAPFCGFTNFRSTNPLFPVSTRYPSIPAGNHPSITFIQTSDLPAQWYSLTTAERISPGRPLIPGRVL